MRKSLKFAVFLTIVILIPFGCGKKKNTSKDITTTITTNKDHVHSFGEWEVLVDSTCTELGTKKRSCACGKVEFEDIPYKDHNYVDDVCTVCGLQKLSSGFTIVYNSDVSEYLITAYSGTKTSVIITRTYNDGVHGVHTLRIRGDVDGEVTTSCLAESSIKKIAMANDFLEMDRSMFSGMKNLEEVILPVASLEQGKSFNEISERAFENCTKLKKVTFNQSLTIIGHYAFNNCALETITTPSSLRKILTNAFANNESLTKITLNDGLTDIEANAFNNTSITSISIPTSLKVFGYQEKMSKLSAFSISGLSSYFSVSNNCLINAKDNELIRAAKGALVPDGVESLGVYSFANMDYSSVNNFVIPNSVKFISSFALSNSTFKNIDFGQIEGLGNKALYNTKYTDYSTKSLVLPDTLTIINDGAFQGMYINEITIPRSVTYLGEAILKGCYAEDVYVYYDTLNSEYCSMYWNSGFDLSKIHKLT